MKSKIIFIAASVVSLALAALCGYVFCTRALGGAALWICVPAYVALLFVSVIFGDLVHEGAHMLAGLCCKMGVKPDRYKLFRTSSVNVCPIGADGMCGRMIATSFAGIAANAVCAVVGIAAALSAGAFSGCCVLLPYSIYLLIINAVPDDRNGAKNDGMMVWELITKSPSAQVMLAVLRVQGMVNGGTALADIPREMLFDLPQLPEDDVNFIVLTRLRCEYFSACGDGEQAQKYLARYNSLAEYLPLEYRSE